VARWQSDIIGNKTSQDKAISLAYPKLIYTDLETPFIMIADK